MVSEFKMPETKDAEVKKLEGRKVAGSEKGMGSTPRRFVFFDSRKALELLEKRPNNVREVCRALGSDRTTWYWHIKNDPEFALRVQEIKEACCDSLEENMFKLGSRRSFKTFNDRIAYLRAHRPQFYNPTKRIIVEGYKMGEKERSQRIGAVEGAIDAEIVKTYQDRKQRQEAKALKQVGEGTGTAGGQDGGGSR